MFMIITEENCMPHYSYFVVHTDDIGGITQNPKHVQLITKVCHGEWKVDVGDPWHMLESHGEGEAMTNRLVLERIT